MKKSDKIMRTNKIKRGLTLIGLTDLEAKVYIKLLKLKEAKVSTLAKATKVTRTQLYPLLENLIEKGVVDRIDKKVIRYKVVNRKKLLDILKKWRKNTNTLLKEFESYLKKIE